MSLNKLALLRYKTIDDCLSNRYRKWTLDDIMSRVTDVLYEHEGITSGVSRRTIQADIQLMRSDKLGYNAPIIVKDKKYYTYDDPTYTITKAPINSADVDKMKEVVGLLKQFNGFQYFDEMSDLIARLENNLYKSTRQSPNYIQFESNNQLKGLEYITPLYQSILHRKSLRIEYKSFQARQAQTHIFFPYLLKEYRNRWFLLGRGKKNETLMTMALDRIISVQELPEEPFLDNGGIDFDQYFDNLVGVTKTARDKAQKVILSVNKANAPYVLTKPLHHSQTLLNENESGIIIRIEVVLNFELEREILGFGECMKVLSPRNLVSRIKKRMDQAVGQYVKGVPSEPQMEIV